MLPERKVVGFKVIYKRPTTGEPVQLEQALTQPLVADSNYLYGLYGDTAVTVFLQAFCLSGASLSSTGDVKFLAQVSGVTSHPIAADAMPVSMRYLGWKPRAACRNAFQAMFFNEVVVRHGNTKRVKLLRPTSSEADFRRAVLAFPDCIASTMESTETHVAVLPMRVNYKLDVPVTIVAKRVIKGALRAIDPDRGGSLQYCFSDADGGREFLSSPVLPRPIITFEGRAGTRWRNGALHPNSTSAEHARVSS